MDFRDRQAIEDLFERLSEVQRASPPRDPEAEAFIRAEIARNPAAPYYMAQTIVMQKQALEEAERRLGTGDERRPSQSPALNEAALGARGRGPWGAPGSGGFLAGAAQTALGVAGGVLLGNMIAGLFGSDEAQAADFGDSAGGGGGAGDETDAGGFETGSDDFGGGDFGDFGDF